MIFERALMQGYLDMDVYDAASGLGVAWVIDPEFDYGEPFDRVLEYLASNIRITLTRDDHMEADVAGFVRSNYEAFRVFTNERSRAPLSRKRTDEDICNGVRCVNGLVAGYYSNEDYLRFMELFGVV